MEFKLYTADVSGDRGNCMYPHEIVITDASTLTGAVATDYVAAKYKGNYRNSENFEESDALALDCDNDDTENPDEWITPEYMADEFASVSYALIPSRNNMKEKNGRAPRPKFHVVFQIDPCTDKDVYKKIKQKIREKYLFFDKNALDAARFFFGSQIQPDDITWHNGFETIEEFLEIDRDSLDNFTADTTASQSKPYAPYSKIIHMGERNSTLSRFAARILKKYGNTDKTYKLFLERAEDCEEPLADTELQTIWGSAVGFFNNTVAADPAYKAPDEYNNDFGNFSLKPDDYTDMGQAAVFAKEYGDVVKYTDATDYIRFNGQFWAESRMACIGTLEEFLDLQLSDARETLSLEKENLLAAGISHEDIDGGPKAVAKVCETEQQMDALELFTKAVAYYAFVMKRRDYKYIQSAANAAKPMLEISINNLDANGFILNTPGMTYDLRKGMEGGYAPNPLDYITKQTLCNPGNQGDLIWSDALNIFFCGNNDLIEYVQRIVGMAAIGEVFMEALIIAYGEGRNGKSTFWNTIAAVLGTYAGTISAETLTIGCRHNARPEMAELKGKRLVIAAELEDGMRLNTAVVKKLCSTDEISAEKKYKDPFKYKPSHTLVLYTNHLPKVGVSDEGTWRRLIVIPFKAKIEGDSDIKNYTQYLTENAGEAVMTWIIEGAEKAIADGFHFKQPAIVESAIARYREENNWLGAFIDECCIVGDDYAQPSGALYQEYRNYCTRTGEFVRSTSDFYSALESAEYERKKTKKGSFVYGLQIREEGFME